MSHLVQTQLLSFAPSEMTVVSVRIDGTAIEDQASFHSVWAVAIGFPSFYGRNMDAWIDCLSYLRSPSAGMTRVVLAPRELLVVEIFEAESFQKRLPDVFNRMVNCASDVNRRFIDLSEPPALVFAFC